MQFEGGGGGGGRRWRGVNPSGYNAKNGKPIFFVIERAFLLILV